MCGIAGFISRGIAEPQHVCRRMTDALSHRGPDDSGVWVDNDAGVALGHRRLAIVDVSSAGHQPMASMGGRYQSSTTAKSTIIWRFASELEAKGRRRNGAAIPTPRTLLAAIEAWGLREGARAVASGMFALRSVGPAGAEPDPRARPARREAALLRRQSGRAVPVRLRAEGAGRSTRDSTPRSTARRSHSILRYSYVPTPHLDLSRHLNKLPPADYPHASRAAASRLIEQYWSGAEAVAEAGAADPLQASPEEAPTSSRSC